MSLFSFVLNHCVLIISIIHPSAKPLVDSLTDGKQLQALVFSSTAKPFSRSCINQVICRKLLKLLSSSILQSTKNAKTSTDISRYWYSFFFFYRFLINPCRFSPLESDETWLKSKFRFIEHIVSLHIFTVFLFFWIQRIRLIRVLKSRFSFRLSP